MNFIISSLNKLCFGSWIGYNHFISNVTKGSLGHMRASLLIIRIKHGFSCINIRQVPWEVLKTEAEGRGFQHLPRDLANVNALKKKKSLLLHKNWDHLLHFALFLALFCFAFSHKKFKWSPLKFCLVSQILVHSLWHVWDHDRDS